MYHLLTLIKQGTYLLPQTWFSQFLAKRQQCWKQKLCAKATLLPKLLTENPNLGDSGGFQPDFPFRTKLSGPECTLIVVVKDFGPEDFFSFHTY